MEQTMSRHRKENPRSRIDACKCARKEAQQGAKVDKRPLQMGPQPPKQKARESVDAPLPGQEVSAQYRKPAERGHPGYHVAQQQSPPAQYARSGAQSFHNVRVRRTRRGRKASELVDIEADKQKSHRG